MRAATVRRFALSLPEAEELETWGEATFRVRNKIFMMLGSDGRRASTARRPGAPNTSATKRMRTESF